MCHTNIASFSNLVVLERIEVVLDVDRSLLDDFRAKEGIGNRSLQPHSATHNQRVSDLTDSAGLTCGDVEAEAEVVLGIGDVGPYIEQTRYFNVSMIKWGIYSAFAITGVKAFAFGFGRKDDAFAFSRFVEVGEVGTVVVDELPLVCGLGDFVLFPLKGGMG